MYKFNDKNFEILKTMRIKYEALVITLIKAPFGSAEKLKAHLEGYKAWLGLCHMANALKWDTTEPFPVPSEVGRVSYAWKTPNDIYDSSFSTTPTLHNTIVKEALQPRLEWLGQVVTEQYKLRNQELYPEQEVFDLTFNLERHLTGELARTVNGHPAVVLARLPEEVVTGGPFRNIGVIYDKDTKRILALERWADNGRCANREEYNLEMAPPPLKKTVWVNVFKTEFGPPYATIEFKERTRETSPSLIISIPIEW